MHEKKELHFDKNRAIKVLNLALAIITYLCYNMVSWHFYKGTY